MSDPIKGLQQLFARPQPPRVMGQRDHALRRYSRTERDAAVYMAQAAMILTVPHRTLVGPEVQAYVNEVLAMPWPRWRQGEQWPVIVRLVPGLTAETGVAQLRSGVAFLPDPVSEVIVLHELAHHLAPCVPPHGTVFVVAFLDLIEHVMNKAAAMALRKHLVLEGIFA